MTTKYHAIPCNIMQYHAITLNINKYHARPSNSVQYDPNHLYHHNPACIPRCYINPRIRWLFFFLIKIKTKIILEAGSPATDMMRGLKYSWAQIGRIWNITEAICFTTLWFFQLGDWLGSNLLEICKLIYWMVFRCASITSQHC